MRPVVFLPVLSLLLAGCISSDLSPAARLGPDAGDVLLQETFKGELVSARAGPVVVSPDQASDVERWFYVHETTQHLTLTLEAQGGEVALRLAGPGCHTDACMTRVETSGGTLVHEVDAPEPGDWTVHLDNAGAGPASITYTLTVDKRETPRPDALIETYEGQVVALHLGATRISPDQLGDVFREFWVHDDTTHLELVLEADDDVYFVVGQATEDETRDRENEQGHDTMDGKLRLDFMGADLKHGGWYFIVFHPAEGPGVKEVAYTVTLTKHLGGHPASEDDAGNGDTQEARR